MTGFKQPDLWWWNRDHSINWATITAGGNCFLFTFQLRSEPTFFFFFWDFSIVCVWLLKLKLAQRLGQKWARKIVRLCGREEERERERERVSANIEWERARAGLESERVVVSVWPDLAKFRHFGKIIEAIGNFWGFIYFLSKLLPTLAKFICHWTKLDCCKWTNMEN